MLSVVGAFLAVVDRRVPAASWRGETIAAATPLLFGVKKNDEEETSAFATFLEKPGSLIVAPILFIFALDLLANIAVITKKLIEYLVAQAI
jgi:hypothetical protein